jgi:hypothetical protein
MPSCQMTTVRLAVANVGAAVIVSTTKRASSHVAATRVSTVYSLLAHTTESDKDKRA